MILDNTLLTKIRTYASLGYSSERICLMLSLPADEAILVKIQIDTPGTDANYVYQQGLAIGDYNKDVELTKQAEKGVLEAIVLLADRKEQRDLEDFVKDRFGI